MFPAQRASRSSGLLWLLVVAAMLPPSYTSGQAIVHFPPKDIIHVPVRWCHVIGSPTFTKDVTGKDDANKILARRLERASEIWRQQAGIEFFLAATIETGIFRGVPTNDPKPPDGFGKLGDIGMEGNEASEAIDVFLQCETAWSRIENALDHNFPGITAVNARFNLSGSTVGLTRRKMPCNPQLCENPLLLGSNDAVTMVVIDERCFTNSSDCFSTFPIDQEQVEVVLPHELGHALYLDHGNGVDDDNDGRFDRCCDNKETATDRTNLMTQDSKGTALTTLQRERARRFARLVPGAWIESPTGLTIGDIVGDEFVDASNDESALVGGGISINTSTGSATVSHRMRRLLQTDGTRRFTAILDLDGNDQTGGAPSALGLRTGFRGAELVTELSVTGSSTNRATTGRIWVHGPRGFGELPREGHDIGAEIVSYHQQNTGGVTHEAATVRFSTKRIGQVKAVVRAQFLAVDSDGRHYETIPAAGGRSAARLQVSAPIAPFCRLSAPISRARERLAIAGGGFPAHVRFRVVLNNEIVATGQVNASGRLNVAFRVPDDVGAGQHFIELHAIGAGFGTNCQPEAPASGAR